MSISLLDWKRIFELSFYKEIYRLWGIPFTPANIKHKPQFIGILTNKFIYENLPKGIFILEKLKEKTPKTKGGHWRYKLHQSLTKDVGREALKKVINTVEALASVSATKGQFLKLMQEKYGQREIQFPNMEEVNQAAKMIEKEPEPDTPTEPDKPIPPFDKMLTGLLSVPPPHKDKPKKE